MMKNLALLVACSALASVAWQFNNAWAGERSDCVSEVSSTACGGEGNQVSTPDPLPSTLAERQLAIGRSLSERDHSQICNGFENADSFSSFKNIVSQSADGRKLEEVFDAISCSFPVHEDHSRNKSIFFRGLHEQSKVARVADTIGYLMDRGVSNERLEAVLNRVRTYRSVVGNEIVFVNGTFLDTFEQRRSSYIENNLGHRVEEIEGYISRLNLLRASEIAAADAEPARSTE